MFCQISNVLLRVCIEVQALLVISILSSYLFCPFHIYFIFIHSLHSYICPPTSLLCKLEYSYLIYSIVLEPVSFFLVLVTQIHFFWIFTVQFLVTTLIHSFLLSKIMIIQHVTSTTYKLKTRSSSISSHITLWISLST